MKKFFCALITILVLFSFACQTSNSISKRDVSSSYYTVAEEFYNLKKYDKAIVYFEKSLSEADEEMKSSIQYKLAKCYVQVNKFEEGKDLFEDLLKLDNENSSLKSSIAYCHLKLYEFDKAEIIYEELIKINPDDQINYKNLILLKIAKNDFVSSEELLKAYEEKFPLDESIKTIKTENNSRKKVFEENNKTNSDSEEQVESDGKPDSKEKKN